MLQNRIHILHQHVHLLPQKNTLIRSNISTYQRSCRCCKRRTSVNVMSTFTFCCNRLISTALVARSLSCGHKFTSNKMINVPRVNSRGSHVILSYFSMSGSGQKEANLRGKNKLYQNFSSVLCLKRKVFVCGQHFFSTSSINYQIGYKLKNNVKDCYSLFNLSPDCSEEELREAYLRLAKQYHPDSGTSTACPRKFSQIQDAYKAIRANMRADLQMPVDMVEEQEEGIFDFPHTLPQHRQYLGNEGIGFGNPTQRQTQYDKYKVQRASEVVTEFRMSKNVLQTETSALAVNKKQAKKSKISNTIERIVQDLIQESMSKGEFDNLSGKGKPLDYNERNPLVDTMTHNINKILINNGYAPQWITLEKEIREDITSIRRRLAIEKKNMNSLTSSSSLDKKWRHHVKVFENSILELNEKIMRFNMIVPVNLLQKQKIPYNVKREIQRVSERYEEYIPPDTHVMSPDISSEMDSYIAERDSESIEWKGTWTFIKETFKSLKS
ncbi:DnaJ homolog subfamily C member 28 [Mytilus galloprovincialis]|uniref:DnaJ homolog subfamily C member 28 n=2 Tax=Mytilus galloprovincialis TaxID=29158 RepID=A0A8B6FPD1_MYTGA|nr:DnaJ homolog subfamily C member 28 [Mytilus galloprovincialis]